MLVSPDTALRKLARTREKHTLYVHPLFEYDFSENLSALVVRSLLVPNKFCTSFGLEAGFELVGSFEFRR